MRHRGYVYSSPTYHTIEVGQTHVIVRERSGRTRCAQILDRDLIDGKVRLLLDRVVHEPHEKYPGWTVSGCFCTEMVAERPEQDE